MRLGNINKQSKVNQQRTKEALSSLASMLKASQDQGIIQINHDMKTLVIAKVQCGLCKQGENPMGHTQPKLQNLSLIRFLLSNEM